MDVVLLLVGEGLCAVLCWTKRNLDCIMAVGLPRVKFTIPRITTKSCISFSTLPTNFGSEGVSNC